MPNTYRIYWPDLDDYSGIQSESLKEVLEHAEACQAPYVIEGTEPFPFCVLLGEAAASLSESEVAGLLGIERVATEAW